MIMRTHSSNIASIAMVYESIKRCLCNFAHKQKKKGDFCTRNLERLPQEIQNEKSASLMIKVRSVTLNDLNKRHEPCIQFDSTAVMLCNSACPEPFER